MNVIGSVSIGIDAAEGTYTFPFALLPHEINAGNGLRSAYVDEELGNKGFTCELETGKTESVLFDDVLYYSADPGVMNNLFLFNLTPVVHSRARSRNKIE